MRLVPRGRAVVVIAGAVVVTAGSARATATGRVETIMGSELDTENEAMVSFGSAKSLDDVCADTNKARPMLSVDAIGLTVRIQVYTADNLLSQAGTGWSVALGRVFVQSPEVPLPDMK